MFNHPNRCDFKTKLKNFDDFGNEDLFGDKRSIDSQNSPNRPVKKVRFSTSTPPISPNSDDEDEPEQCKKMDNSIPPFSLEIAKEFFKPQNIARASKFFEDITQSHINGCFFLLSSNKIYQKSLIIFNERKENL